MTNWLNYSLTYSLSHAFYKTTHTSRIKQLTRKPRHQILMLHGLWRCITPLHTLTPSPSTPSYIHTHTPTNSHIHSLTHTHTHTHTHTQDSHTYTIYPLIHTRTHAHTRAHTHITYDSSDSPGGSCTCTSPPSLARSWHESPPLLSTSPNSVTCLPLNWGRSLELTRGKQAESMINWVSE
jgi:hypothetical protein